MTLRFDVRHKEQGYRRSALFAVELLDAVTLERVTHGITIVADGLRGAPIVNTSGLFVWRKEDLALFQKVSINPGILPYESLDVPRAQLRLPPTVIPLTTIELPPLANYPFAAGITAARGTLIEEHAVPLIPVANAAIGLRWLDEDGTTWRDAPITSHTTARGDFVSVLRLTPTQVPHVDANGALTVRLRAGRGAHTRVSSDLTLPQGRVADPSTLTTLIVAWDEMQA